MKKLFLLLITLITVENLIAQTVFVNPDGTHSVVIDNGSTKTIVNLNENQQEVDNIISSDKMKIEKSKKKKNNR
jgi:hypothetical protein